MQQIQPAATAAQRLSITPRTPDIHAEEAPVVWSRIPEFAQYWNGASVFIPYVEHYLVNVIGEIRAKCGDNDAALRKELDLFIEQENNHSLYHLRFNKRMYDAHYEELKPLIVQIKAELRELREKRSLAFNIAYCAGFENVATFTAKFMFEAAGDLFEGADARGADIFLWHIAEEFEHRSVCHDAFRHVSGNYFTRLYGLIYSFWHIGSCFARCAAAVLTKHREGMSPQERKLSIRRERAIMWRQYAYVLPRMTVLLLPGFHPSRIKTPPRVQAALNFYTAMFQTTQRFGFTAAERNSA